MRFLKRLLIGFVVCTLLAAFLTSQYFFHPALSENRERWRQILVHSLFTTYLWGLLTFGIYAVASRVGINRQRWVRSIAILFGTGIAFSAAHVLISTVSFVLFAPSEGASEMQSNIGLLQSIGAIQSNMIIYSVILSFCLAINYYTKYQDRELRNSRLEAQLAQAQLGALKSQLQPHFLFNTLNGILVLVRENPAQAEQMIVRLSDMLRSTLENMETEEVTLECELRLIHLYLDIERMRFGDRLEVTERIDPNTENALVPTLLLQPLVENAIRHGVAKISETCQVNIAAEKRNGELRLSISDSGPGTKGDVPIRKGGVGIANTVERLKHLYGNRYEFSTTNLPTGGFAVSIELPFHESSQDRSSDEAAQ